MEIVIKDKYAASSFLKGGQSLPCVRDLSKVIPTVAQFCDTDEEAVKTAEVWNAEHRKYIIGHLKRNFVEVKEDTNVNS